jgi:hypothetical protein
MLLKKRKKHVLWIGTAFGGNYTEVLSTAIASLRPGCVYEVNVRHDEKCTVFHAMPYNCACDIEIVESGHKPPEAA